MARQYFVGGPRDAEYQDTVEEVPEVAVFNRDDEKTGRYILSGRKVGNEGIEGNLWLWTLNLVTN